jgi:hypothetical protein
MVNSSDKPEQEKLQQDVKTATQEVDAVLAAGQGTGDGRAGGAVQEDDWPARVALGLRSGPGWEPRAARAEVVLVTWRPSIAGSGRCADPLSSNLKAFRPTTTRQAADRRPPAA